MHCIYTVYDSFPYIYTIYMDENQKHDRLIHGSLIHICIKISMLPYM